MAGSWGPRAGLRGAVAAGELGSLDGLALGGADEMGEEEGVRQGADTTGYRRDRGCDLARRSEVDVPDDVPVDDVDSDVDDDRAWLEHGAGDEAGPAGGDDDDVGSTRMNRQVARLRVADGHRRRAPPPPATPRPSPHLPT